MVGPMLTDQALAPLRAVDEASLIHRAYKGTVTSVRGPGGKYTDTVVYATVAMPCRLNPLGDEVELRADQPSTAKRFTVAVPSGTLVTPGEPWRIEGETNGFAWTRNLVAVQVRDPRSQQSRRRVIMLDTELNP